MRFPQNGSIFLRIGRLLLEFPPARQFYWLPGVGKLHLIRALRNCSIKDASIPVPE